MAAEVNKKFWAGSKPFISGLTDGQRTPDFLRNNSAFMYACNNIYLNLRGLELFLVKTKKKIS